jgi:uncharacterized alkaline shock family protein YloU
MSQSGMDNTTQQIYLGRDEPTTHGQIPPAAPSAPPEPVSGRVAAATAAAPPPVPEAATAPPDVAPVPRHDEARGRTTIADEVVERVIQKVVDLAVDEVDGVHGLRPGVDRFFGGDGGEEGDGGGGEGGDEGSRAPETERAVAVSLAGDQATINLSIEVDFGHAVHEVVDQVRTAVIESAERLLGMTIAEVNVVVSDVSFSEPAGDPDDET